MSDNLSFAKLLDKEDLSGSGSLLRKIVKGQVVALANNMVLVDVGLKSEGWIPLAEFSSAEDGEVIPTVGDSVEVYVERLVGQDGQTVLSRVRARREESWQKIEESYANGQPISGLIKSRIRGGYQVDIDGAQAFLPGSQVDVRPVKDIQPLIDTLQPFRVLKINRQRGNIVVSRRSVMEETRAEKRDQLYSSLEEGQVLEGIVKNITDYGAFIDLGGIDGLVHVTDISWRRINHASEPLTTGERINVKVLRYNRKDGRVSLGIKQLTPDPWEGVELKFPVGAKINAVVTNVAEYGAFVELEQGIEGLIHVSEMSWTKKKNILPSKILAVADRVNVMILDINTEKRRVSLGLKQCTPNPYQLFSDNHKSGDTVTGKVSSVTDFGLFVGLQEDLDGMVHVSDLSWDADDQKKDKISSNYKKGDEVTVKLLEVNPAKERISLGIKQLTEDPIRMILDKYKRGSIHTCVVERINEGGVEVALDDKSLKGFIKRSELGRNRADQRPDRFAPGEKLDARVISVDRSKRGVKFSIKALEVEEMKQAMHDYGSTESGASLGEILGEALKGKARKQSEIEYATSNKADDDTKDSSALKKTGSTKTAGKTAGESAKEATSEPSSETTKESASKTTNESSSESAKESAKKTAKETAKETASADNKKDDGVATQEKTDESDVTERSGQSEGSKKK